MMNRLYQQMNGGGGNIFQQIAQLKQRMGGDPNKHIQDLLNSGKITQADYDRAVKRAEELRRMLGK